MGISLSVLYRFLRKPVGIAGLILISILFAVVVKGMGIKGAVVIVIALLGPPFAIALVAMPRFGVKVLLVAAYLLFGLMRMNVTTFPLGTLIDGLLLLMMIGVVIDRKYRNDWNFMRSPISIMITVWIGYNFLQVINPEAASRMAWLYTIRGLALVMLSYYIFAAHITDIKFVRSIIKLWLGLSLAGALWGLKQQFIGFTNYEYEYLYSDPIIMDLMFIGGQWRKFSFFSDPTAFSYNMVVSALLCIGLLHGPFSIKKKAVLGFLTVLFIMSMLYSGTRSAYVLIPAALAMLCVLIFNLRIMIVAGVMAFMLAFLIFVPTGNPTLYRFQSAFKPSDDPSFNVRASNQKLIQPYIRSHALGGGLGSTGVWGVKFSPDSFLASFPPDSGYVRVAVESGWIGLLLFCSLMFVIIRKGIISYFTIKDPELRSYCLSMIIIVYALIVGNYPQEALTQYPLSIYFLLVAALINCLKDIDQKLTSDKETPPYQHQTHHELDKHFKMPN